MSGKYRDMDTIWSTVMPDEPCLTRLHLLLTISKDKARVCHKPSKSCIYIVTTGQLISTRICCMPSGKHVQTVRPVS